MIVWRDGEFVDGGSAIGVEDRGWLIGDAAFETVLVDNARAAFLDRHLARLDRGARTLGMNACIDTGKIAAAIAETARRSGVDGRGACRLTLSRVGGPRGLAPSAAARARLVISIAPAAPPREPMRLIISGRRRWTGASTNAFKCAGAYAENFLARAEAAAAGANEAVMLNEKGRVACLSAANIFIVREGEIVTPSEEEGALAGVVRGVLIEEAGRMGIRVKEALIAPEKLSGAAMIATNSIAGAVRSVLYGEATIEDAETADRLIAAYDRRLAEEFAAPAPEEKA